MKYMKKFVLSQKTKQQLKRLGVTALYLFGSRAQNLAGPLSDYDFGILMKKAGYDYEKTYNSLYDILSPLCPRKFPNDIIDIVFLDRVSLELQINVIRYGRLLFNDNKNITANYEARIMLQTADFAPLRKSLSKIILLRV